MLYGARSNLFYNYCFVAIFSDSSGAFKLDSREEMAYTRSSLETLYSRQYRYLLRLSEKVKSATSRLTTVVGDTRVLKKVAAYHLNHLFSGQGRANPLGGADNRRASAPARFERLQLGQDPLQVHESASELADRKLAVGLTALHPELRVQSNNHGGY